MTCVNESVASCASAGYSSPISLSFSNPGRSWVICSCSLNENEQPSLRSAKEGRMDEMEWTHLAGVPGRRNDMSNGTLGFLQTCIDKRFVAETRRVFEQWTNLAPTEYWHEAYAGGAARDPSLVENDPKTGNNIYAHAYAAKHGATIFGWQAHVDGCGGLPGAGNTEIEKALDEHISAMMAKYPTFQHYRILASDAGIDIKRVR